MSHDIVHLESDGLRLQGVLVTPAGFSGPRPAVVMSHGWSGAVNHRVLPLADLLARAGYVSLALDHRGFGGSEGVRGRSEPAEQARDVSAAARWLAGRDDVDGTAIGVLGASFGGAIAIASAARDDFLRACVAIVPVGDGERWLSGLHGDAWAGLRTRAEADPAARVELPSMMPMPDTEPARAEAELMRQAQPAGYPLENALLAAAFSPESESAAIAPRALCVIATEDDSVVPVEQAKRVHAAAGEPKELHLLPQGDHGGPLGPLVETTAEIVLAFFDRHLAGVRA
ncbi:alpha/beta hydrolase [Pseudonocardia ailaonensis]|uniref:alpha/beta hydrolase n=1 Tax=Pseudonocardia ailaonensis TaxID=367279 RepID=UPI003CD0B511